MSQAPGRCLAQLAARVRGVWARALNAGRQAAAREGGVCVPVCSGPLACQKRCPGCRLET